MSNRPGAWRTRPEQLTGSIAPVITPFSADGEVDHASLANLVEWQLKQGSDGISIGGSTGEPGAQTVAERGPLLFQRPLREDEQAAYVELGTKSVAALGEDEAAALAFQQMLLSPAFLFRSELGQGTPDAAGRVRLSPFEAAAMLSYTLTDKPPDEALWNAAAAGQLADLQWAH